MLVSLKNKQDFNNVYKNGKVFGNRNFTLHYIKNGMDTNRLGVVVSKKVSKRAVHRNKIRRQVKNYMRQYNGELKNGYDMIISAKSSCLDEDYKVLTKSLNHLFYKQDLLKK